VCAHTAAVTDSIRDRTSANRSSTYSARWGANVLASRAASGFSWPRRRAGTGHGL